MMQDDYTKLKQLLFQEEIDQLNTITRILKNLEKKQRQDVVVEDLSKLMTKILSKSIEENSLKLYATLEPLISKGLYCELSKNDNELQNMLFPLISSSLYQQIEKEQDALINAFSPLMGSMFRGYIVHGFKSKIEYLNSKIKNFLTIQNHERKKEQENWIPIHAMFLIHKDSTLLIAHQVSQNHQSIDKVEVMSKIRHHLYRVEEQESQESYELEYGEYRISLESGSSCYLAIVTDNDMQSENKLKNQLLKNRVTHVLKTLLEENAHSIEKFDGDSTQLNMKAINRTLSTLFGNMKPKSKKFPWYAAIFLTLLLSLPIAWLGNYTYKNYLNLQEEQRVEEILKSKLKIYDFQIIRNQNNTIVLSGLVKSESQREEVEVLLRGYNIINTIESVSTHERYSANKLLEDIYAISNAL
jgi:hypothetical protein